MIAFRAHRLQVNQTGFTVGNYSPCYFPNTAPDPYYNAPGYDIGTRFASSLWTPVLSGEEAPQKVTFDGQLWIKSPTAYLGSGHYFVGRIVKNGYPAGVSIGAKIATKGGFTTAICGLEDWVIDLSMQDIAMPGDSYGVYLYTPAAGAILDGISLHSWWSGMVVA